MKVYIPTTILNIGELLTTDSISPASFYKKRSFGSKHWYNVEENGSEHVILLYKKCFRFYRPKSDLEDRPMLICMEVDETLPKWQDGVFYSDSTLYFDWNTRFLFYSEEDRRVAISLAKICDSAKMLGLYQEKRMECIQEQVDKLNVKIEEKYISVNIDAIENDYRYNTLKGIIYGYYIGAILSARPIEIGFLNGLRDLYKHVRSVGTSFAPFKKDTDEVVNAIWDTAKKDIELQESKMKDQQCPLQIEKKELKIVGQRVVSISNVNIKSGIEHELLLFWLNRTLCDKDLGLCVNAVKMDLADKLTDAAKIIYKDEWNESETRAFLNNLRHHIAGQPFTQEWNNGILSSLMAFLLRGDDWRDMLQYMQEHDMYDYRLAFAFYGAFFGFARMLRNLTDNIIRQDKEYVGKFYNEVYRMLFGKDIPKIVFNRNADIQQWQNEIKRFVAINKPKDKNAMQSLEEAFAEIGNEIDNYKLLEILKNKKGWGGRSNLKKVFCKRFTPDKKEESNTNKDLQITLFDKHDNK